MKPITQIQQIKSDLRERRYTLVKVEEINKNPSQKKRIKRLIKKVKKAREESTKERMLLSFELGKEMGEDRAKGGNKHDKTLAQRIYKNFETTYPWMPWNKNWKLRYLQKINAQDVEEVSYIWISMELNPVEGDNM